jgi:hypothetical protein
MKRLITASDRYTPKGGYLYIFKHGIGPGTIPSDVSVVKTKDLPNYYTAVWLDRFLTADELKKYDIPSETEINRYLDRIGYCQKNGDVAPCDDVEACGEITASSRATSWGESMYGGYYFNYIDDRGHVSGVRTETLQELKAKAAELGLDIKQAQRFDNTGDSLGIEFDDVEACDAVTASTIPTSDIKLLAKEVLNCNTRDELSSVIGSLQSIDKKLYLHYMELFRDNSLSVAYIASQLSDELMSYYVDDIDACNDVMASQRFEVIIKRYGEPAEEEVVTAESQQALEDKLNNDGYIDWWDYNSGKTYDPWETVNEVNDDDVEACDKVMASEDDEDKIYWVQAYYSKPHKGLADDFATNDWDAAIEKLVDFANDGYYVMFENLASGEGYEYDPDEVLSAVESGDIYTLRRLNSLYEG